MKRSVRVMLDEIRQTIKPVAQDQSLNPQQAMFVTHIEKTTDRLQQQIEFLPDREYAELQVLPVLGEQFLQPLVAIYGYAKLLLDSPQSFDGALVTGENRASLEAIFSTGRALEQHIESLSQQAFQHRLDARKSPPQSLDLQAFIAENLPIYRYWIRDCAVQIQHTQENILDHQPITIVARPYHLNALFQHIISVMAREWIEYGVIRLSTEIMDEFAELAIFCTGVQLMEQDMETLFHKDGRAVYLQQLQKMGGDIETSVQAGVGSTIIVRLPCAV